MFFGKGLAVWGAGGITVPAIILIALQTAINPAGMSGQAFDAISIKPHPMGPNGRANAFKMVTDPVMIDFVGVTVADLIKYAYDLRSVKQIQGGAALGQ